MVLHILSDDSETDTFQNEFVPENDNIEDYVIETEWDGYSNIIRDSICQYLQDISRPQNAKQNS